MSHMAASQIIIPRKQLKNAHREEGCLNKIPTEAQTQSRHCRTHPAAHTAPSQACMCSILTHPCTM